MNIPPDYMLFFLIVIVFTAAFILLPIPQWIMAKRYGAQITFIEAMMMSFRRVKAGRILNALSLAASAKIDVTAEELEKHYLAGGDVQKVVLAMIREKKKGEAIYKKDFFKADLEQ